MKSAERPWQHPISWLLLACLLCIGIYWPGLSGPFIFDDGPHLRLVQSWRQGEIGFFDMAAGNGGILFNRSLAMASLAANIAIGGDSSFSLKLGNLALHILCAWLAFATISLLLRRDKNLHSNAQKIAALICAVWVLHPMNVSTVLYVIQRMSEIAAASVLAGIYFYALVRNRMISHAVSQTTGFLLLILGAFCFIVLGIQGKQSALVLPGMCLAIEIGWYQRATQWPNSLRWFYTLSVALPILGIAAIVAVRWEWLQSGMREWGMTVGERLLSEPRALCEYARMTLVPYAPTMGIYTDDFEISRSWNQPWTTLPAIALLLLVSLVTWRFRRQRPALFVGWLWYLTAHSVEASIVPIELYYEHRNYLPSLGLLLMCADLLSIASSWLRRRGISLIRFAPTLTMFLLFSLSLQTLLLSLQWRSLYGIALSAILSHPHSARAYIDYGRAALKANRPKDAYAAFNQLATSDDPSLASIGKLELTLLNCNFVGDSDPHLFQAAVKQSPKYLNNVVQYAVGDLGGVLESKGCGRLTMMAFADGVSRIIEQATVQTEASQSKWSLRYVAALAYYHANAWPSALTHARIAWKNAPDPSMALLYVKLLLNNREYDGAKEAFSDVMVRAGYRRVEQIYGGTRGTALRAMKKELDAYAAQHGLSPISESALDLRNSSAPAGSTKP